MLRFVGVALLSLTLPWAAYGEEAGRTSAAEAVLPPPPPWSGSSRELVLTADDPWATPFENSGLKETPRYDETVAWLERLVAAAPELTMVSIGRSHEGRDIVMVVASSSGAPTPSGVHGSGKPVVLVHGGIHSGEIDGKDAGMMLLRDMTVRGTRSELLHKATFLFIPILSVDGHERFSAHGRINQRGPAKTGWRTNARNQNLNRDFAKLDTPEVRALVRAINAWAPDLYVDVHVTDGIDWQYDITWGYNGAHGHSPSTARWLAGHLDPAATRALEAHGHVPGPLVFPVDRRDITRGVVEWTASVRFSNGWGDARHLPTVLVENHALKPFDRRVLGTYLFLASVIESVGEHDAELREAVASDRARRPGSVPLAWRIPEGAAPEQHELLAVEQHLEPSTISGGKRVVYTGRPKALEVPWYAYTEPRSTVVPPTAYWVPPAWGDVIERLEAHGVEMERIAEPRRVEVEMYRLADAKIDPDPFEGRVRVSAGAVPERRVETFPPGSVRVPVDQPLGVLAVLLLEPASPDSFLQWGFFLEVLQRTEYVEAYIMEPTARAMLEADPSLEAEFERKLRDDPALAADPRARLHWFYERTPYFDDRWNLYPVAREIGTPAAD
jgi:murein tripeptide amidase MpaA